MLEALSMCDLRASCSLNLSIHFRMLGSALSLTFIIKLAAELQKSKFIGEIRYNDETH